MSGMMWTSVREKELGQLCSCIQVMESGQARLDDSREGIGKEGGRGRRVEDETHLVSGL